MNTPTPQRGASLGTWLLRIFLASFILAAVAPVAVAVAILHVSGDTRALRNAVVKGDTAQWKKQVEVSVGSLPFAAARLALPFVDIDPDAKLAATAIRSVDVSVHELTSSAPDRARVIADADERMSKRGWDRLVGVLEGDTAVAVYVTPEGVKGDLKVSVLVLSGRQMVAVTGRGDLRPLMDIAMRKAHEELPELQRGRRLPIIARWN